MDRKLNISTFQFGSESSSVYSNIGTIRCLEIDLFGMDMIFVMISVRRFEKNHSDQVLKIFHNNHQWKSSEETLSKVCYLYSNYIKIHPQVVNRTMVLRCDVKTICVRSNYFFIPRLDINFHSQTYDNINR